MKPIAYIAMLAFVISTSAVAAKSSFLCEMHKGSQSSDGTQSLGPSFGQAAIIDSGNSFFIYVNERLQLQSPKLKRNDKTMTATEPSGYGYVKGDGFYFVGTENDGFLFDDCVKQ